MDNGMFIYGIETFGRTNSLSRQGALDVLASLALANGNVLPSGKRIVYVRAFRSLGFERYANNERLDNGECIPYMARHGYSHWFSNRGMQGLEDDCFAYRLPKALVKRLAERNARIAILRDKLIGGNNAN